MHSFDYEACVYDGAIYCNGCLPDGIDPDHAEVSPIFADSETDSYPVCDRCGREHDYMSLTPWGERNRYLRAEHKDVAALRDDKGRLPSFAWPGGYPIYYLCQGNDVHCPDCANAYLDADDPLSAADTHLEGPALYCDNCNAEIESAYGDPDEPLDNSADAS